MNDSSEPTTRDRRGILGLGVALVSLAVAGGTYWSVSATREGPAAPRVPASRPLEGHEMRFGPISPPKPLPAARVRLDDGSDAVLTDVLRGHWTMLQLMFTSCSTTCPIQGAVFQRVETMIAPDGGAFELMSLSIDPAGDSPSAMRSWLDGFEAGRYWRGAIPDIGDLDAIAAVLNGAGDGVDVHDARIYFIDPEGNLVYATEDMPAPEVLFSLSREALAGPG
jgi:protein SCO1/2